MHTVDGSPFARHWSAWCGNTGQPRQRTLSTRYMRSVGKPSADSRRVAAISDGTSPFGWPYFTFTVSPLASVHRNFGVVPPTFFRLNVQSTSAAGSKLSAPGGLRVKSADPMGTGGRTHTRARASEAWRAAADTSSGGLAPFGGLECFS